MLNVRECEGGTDHVLEKRAHDIGVHGLAIEQRLSDYAAGKAEVLEVALIRDARVRRNLERRVARA